MGEVGKLCRIEGGEGRDGEERMKESTEAIKNHDSLVFSDVIHIK